MNGYKRKVFRFSIGIIAVLFLAANSAQAHAVLLEATPAPNSTVAKPNLAIRLKFNVRIETPRSRLSLLLPDNSTIPVEIRKDSTADILLAQVSNLKSGKYRLRWQVLASDGHISRGEIPFTVGAS